MERITWVNLTQRLMKVSFLVIHCIRHAYRAYNKRTMLVEESMHITFDETNQNMQESPKTSADDEVPDAQQVDNNLDNKSKEASNLLEIQSIEQRDQSIESRAGGNTVNSGLPTE